MILLRPSALWLLAPVGAVAMIVLLRPGRRLTPVAGVRLWREAAAELQTDRRVTRSMSLSWILLTLGAIAAVVALAEPVWLPTAKPDLPSRSTTVTDLTVIPMIRVDAVAAERLDDGSSQLMIATIRPDEGSPEYTTLHVSFVGMAADVTREVDLSVERAVEIIDVSPGVRQIDVRIGFDGATLTWQAASAVAIAIIGADNPFIARAVGAMGEGATIVDAAAADIVIANGVDVADDRPAIVLDGPTPPPRWHRREATGPMTLADANLLADDPLLAYVDLSAVAVRRARPLIADPVAAGRRLVSTDAGTLILATDRPRRLHVAFDPGPDNSNWGLDESFPILMDAAIRWMADDPSLARWEVTYGMSSISVAPPAPPELPPVDETSALWPHFAAAAGVLWLLGWWRRRFN